MFSLEQSEWPGIAYNEPVNSTTPATSERVACPFCKSWDVKTTSKEVNASTYWRCTACGQIWNASRLPQVRRTPYGFR